MGRRSGRFGRRSRLGRDLRESRPSAAYAGVRFARSPEHRITRLAQCSGLRFFSVADNRAVLRLSLEVNPTTSRGHPSFSCSEALLREGGSFHGHAAIQVAGGSMSRSCPASGCVRSSARCAWGCDGNGLRPSRVTRTVHAYEGWSPHRRPDSRERCRHARRRNSNVHRGTPITTCVPPGEGCTPGWSKQAS
jgi:hypothetical protein